MQIILIYNPKAGRGDFDCDDLMRKLRDAGHEPKHYSIKEPGYKKALKERSGLALVAGGDGTVGKVARQLVGRDLPLSVLPIGTANNLARTLGFSGAPEDIIASIDRGTRRRFDVGRARGACGKRYFFEAAGGGLLPAYWRELAGFVDVANKVVPASRKREMKRHVAMLRQLVSGYKPSKWKIVVDDAELTDCLLLLEAMNIRSLGPVLNLAPRAHTDDGRLDLVTVDVNDRTKFSDYLEARFDEDKVEFPFPTRRFRRLKIFRGKAPLHFDDEIWPRKKVKSSAADDIEITIEPGALTVLLPPRRSASSRKAGPMRADS